MSGMKVAIVNTPSTTVFSQDHPRSTIGLGQCGGSGTAGRGNSRRARMILVLCLLAMSLPMSAADRIWTGASNGNWSVPGNWVGNTPPSNGDRIIFNASSSGTRATSNDIGSLTNLTVLVSGDPGAAVSISGNAIGLAAGGVDLSAAAQDLTLSCPVTLEADQNWAVATGRTLTVSGAIDGSGALTKTGAGTLVLSGGNSYSGLTTVSAGVLNIRHNTALGTAAAGTVVADGATLELQGDITVGNEALTLNGTGALGIGGTITDVGGYRIHTFTGNGTFTASVNGTVDVLVVGGGGSGGNSIGGGGGAGGLISTSLSLTAANYDVIIGAGGTVPVGGRQAGNNGGDSTFRNVGLGVVQTAIGGGGGGANDAGQSSGKTGGSGGGRTDATSYGGSPGGANQPGGFANAGGQSFAADGYAGAGGGGAGQAGEATGVDGQNYGGDGGDGMQSSITGTPTYYAGGGGGRQNAFGGGVNGTGGLGGGGDAGSAATFYGGGGGGGTGNPGNGGAGYQGIVIVRYLLSGTPMRNVSGTNIWQGTVTLGSSANITADAGSLTFNTAANSITANNRDLIVAGAGAVTVAGTITIGSGAVTKGDAGTLNLTGANTLSAMSVVAGTVSFAGASSTTLTTLTVAGGTVNFTGSTSTTVTTLMVTGGTVVVGPSMSVVTADFSNPGTGVVNATVPLTINSTLNLSGPITATLGGGGTSFSVGGTNIVNDNQTRTVTLSGGTLTLTNNGGVATAIDLRTLAIQGISGGSSATVKCSSNYSGNDTQRAAYNTADGTNMTWTSFPTGTAGNNSSDMWLSNGTKGAGTWIAWDLGATYTISKMHVWNYNENSWGNRGVKTLILEKNCTDFTNNPGVNGNWTTVLSSVDWESIGANGSISGTVKGTGSAGIAGFDWTLPTPITTRYIRFKDVDNFAGGDNYVGLSEIVFFRTSPSALPNTNFAITASSTLDLQDSLSNHTLGALQLATGTTLTLQNANTATFSGACTRTGAAIITAGTPAPTGITVNGVSSTGSINTLSVTGMGLTLAGTTTMRIDGNNSDVVAMTSGTVTFGGTLTASILNSPTSARTYTVFSGAKTGTLTSTLGAAPSGYSWHDFSGSTFDATNGQIQLDVVDLFLTLSTPADAAGHTLNVRPALVWMVPYKAGGGTLDFRVSVDGSQVADSATDWTQFEYLNSGVWTILASANTVPAETAPGNIGTHKVRWRPPASTPMSVAAHTWKVCAVAGGTPGPDSATRTFTIASPPWVADLIPGIPIRAVNLTELRTEADLARAFRGLAAYSWTDSITARVTRIRKAHLEDLRSALTPVFAEAGYVKHGTRPDTIDPGTEADFYSEAIVPNMTQVRSVHFQRIRDALSGY